MDTQRADFMPVRFSTDDLPGRDRIPIWREFFGPKVLHTEIEPLSDAPFHADITLRLLPGACLVSQIDSPVCLRRTPALTADGNDDVGLFVNTSGGTVTQRGRELAFAAGDAVIATAAEVATAVNPCAAHYRCFHFPRAALAPFVADIDEAATLRLIPPGNEALKYMLSYARFAIEDRALADPELARLAAIHLQDIFALVLGATRDAAVVAEERGLRVARLMAIKADIVYHLNQPGLTVSAIAARHAITPRYVQLLFEGEGTTFSWFVLHKRLERVHRLLTDPRFARHAISALAIEVGFGDISYFNRAFRRRYGLTPSDVREQARLR